MNIISINYETSGTTNRFMLQKTKKSVSFCSKSVYIQKETTKCKSLYEHLILFFKKLFAMKKTNSQAFSDNIEALPNSPKELAKHAGLSIERYTDNLSQLKGIVDNTELCLSDRKEEKEIKRALATMMMCITKAKIRKDIDIFQIQDRVEITTIIRESINGMLDKETLKYLEELWNKRVLYPNLKMKKSK